MRAFPTRTPGRVQGIGPDTAYVVRELGLSRRTRRLGEFTLPSDGLGAPEIIYLREQGVSDRVITAMLKQHSKAPVAPAPAAPASVTTIWAAPAQSSTTFAAAAPVYTQPTTVYVALPATTYVDYYPSYRYYYPYYSPVSLSFGFGFGGYYGGYHGGDGSGGGGFHRGGGHHRGSGRQTRVGFQLG